LEKRIIIMTPVNGISGINGLDVQHSLDHASSPNGDLQSLANRFSDLLSKEPSAQPVPEVGAPSVLSHVVGEHERMYRGLFHDIAKTSLDIDKMTPQQATAKQMELMFRTANVTVQHNACTYVAQSAKSGLQTLMKNQ
jgi:type III secretion inner rod protein HrpB2